MKHLLISALLLLACGVSAWGQYPGTLKRSGTHLTLNDERLTPEEQAAILDDIGGQDCTEAWRRAATLRNTGLGLTIAGGVAGAAGIMFTFTGGVVSTMGAVVGTLGGKEGAQKGARAGSPMLTGGLIAAGVGLAALGAGIPLLAVGSARLNRMVETYNNNKPVTVSLGPAPSGLGLCLRF